MLYLKFYIAVLLLLLLLYMYCSIFYLTIILNKLSGVGQVPYVLAVDCSVVVSVPTVVETI